MSYHLQQDISSTQLLQERSFAMVRPQRDVTEAELALLRHLWETENASVRDLAEACYGETDATTRATVKKLLDRLETKRIVKRNKRAAVHLYRAAVSRDELLGKRLKSLASELCDGSRMPLLVRLISEKPLKEEECQALRELLDRHRKE